jgi:hypothetical protein
MRFHHVRYCTLSEVRDWWNKADGHEPGSLVSTVSDYGLNDRAIGVRSTTKARVFFP